MRHGKTFDSHVRCQFSPNVAHITNVDDTLADIKYYRNIKVFIFSVLIVSIWLLKVPSLDEGQTSFAQYYSIHLNYRSLMSEQITTAAMNLIFI